MRWSIEPKAEADNTGRIMSRKMIVVKKTIKVAMKTKRYSLITTRCKAKYVFSSYERGTERKF